ncbi:MAG: NTP transferase domain-containing protein [Melioribacteraceae bacterium]|nr:NTP transferase domain-containing protein [Melioribacteraceae bacterium]
MKAVIIAAGMGSRIKDKTDGTPKTLLPFKHGTILSTILNNIAQAEIREFVIVVGYKSEQIINYLNKNENFGFQITIVNNNEWLKGNGLSVLASENSVGEEKFLLSMSDHIVSISALIGIANFNSDKNLLLVDPDIENSFDIDDATKVEVDGINIINIGKEIANYNGLDCGIFRLNKRFFDAMREQLKDNNESISAAICELIKEKDMQAVLTKEEDYWYDIDTPEAYNNCHSKLLEMN